MADTMLKQAAKAIIVSLDYYQNMVQQDKQGFIESMVRINEEFRRSIGDGDLRENAAYEQAQRDINELTINTNSAESQLGAIERCKQGALSYKSTKIITNYSTVQLKRVNINEGKVLEGVDDEYIFTLFPYGITQPSAGILSSSDSVVGKQLMGKRIGDEIKMRDRTTGALATYKIVDVE